MNTRIYIQNKQVTVNSDLFNLFTAKCLLENKDWKDELNKQEIRSWTTTREVIERYMIFQICKTEIIDMYICTR